MRYPSRAFPTWRTCLEVDPWGRSGNQRTLPKWRDRGGYTWVSGNSSGCDGGGNGGPYEGKGCRGIESVECVDLGSTESTATESATTGVRRRPCCKMMKLDAGRKLCPCKLA